MTYKLRKFGNIRYTWEDVKYDAVSPVFYRLSI
jgi:hypothetical protein